MIALGKAVGRTECEESRLDLQQLERLEMA